jgi:hypothetical protein
MRERLSAVPLMGGMARCHSHRRLTPVLPHKENSCAVALMIDTSPSLDYISAIGQGGRIQRFFKIIQGKRRDAP